MAFNHTHLALALSLYAVGGCSGAEIVKTPKDYRVEALQDLKRFYLPADESLLRCGYDEYFLRQQAEDAAVEKWLVEKEDYVIALVEDPSGVRRVLTHSQNVYEIKDVPSYLGYSDEGEFKCVQAVLPYNVKKIGQGVETYTALLQF